MYITLTGYIFLILCTIFSFFDIQKFLYLLLVSLILQSSAFGIIGKGQVPLSIFVELFFCVVCFAKEKLRKIALRKEHIALLLFSAWFSVITIISPILFPNMKVMNYATFSYQTLSFSWGKLSMCIYLLIDVWTFIVIYNNRQHFESHKLIQYMKACVVFVMIIGIWQYYMANNGGVSDTFLSLIFSSNAVVSPTYYQTRFFSTFYEPSYCGLFLGAAFWGFVAFDQQITRSNLLILGMLLIMLCMNISTTGVFTFCAGGLIYGIINLRQKEIRLKYVAIILLGALMIFSAFHFKIINIDQVLLQIINKVQSTSYDVRSRWNTTSVQTFFDSYFIGCGAGYTRASSFFLQLLAQGGLLGTGLFIYSIVMIIYTQKGSGENAFAMIYLVATMCGMFFSSPDITLSNIWIGIYLAATNYGVAEKKQMVNLSEVYKNMSGI